MIGSRIGHLRVTGILGQGGMGDVYRAVDERLDRPVALKVIRGDQHATNEWRARFMREARVLSALDHPNICRIHEYLEGERGDFLVLELIDGVTLTEAIEQGMSRARKMRIALEIADALAAAHRKGIVHRDLKTENVMITPAGSAKILDFGLARHEADAPEASEELAADETFESSRTLLYRLNGSAPRPEPSVTATGYAMGTPSTMSPEQATGQVASPASDMYSFGLLLQTLFTEKPVHPDGLGAMELVVRASRGVSEPMTGQSHDITALVNRLKSRAPADRPTAVDTLQTLRRIVEAPARRARYAVITVTLLIVMAMVVKYVVDVSAARREAERQRRQAEELVSFIVGDLHAKLESVGRLDALDAAAQRALGYFASLRAEDLGGSDLHRHALALAQLGQVRVDEGKLDDAVKLFNESLRFASAAVSRDAKREDWQLALSNAHFWLGESLRLRGDHRGALVHFRTYLDIARRLATAHPGNDRYEAELGYGHANVGAAHEAAGDIKPALQEYRTSVAVARHRVALGPQYVQRHEDLASSLNLTGVALQADGDLAGARAILNEELAERRKLVAAAPNDAPRMQRLATALAFMGQLHKTLHDPEEAAAAYREELDLATRLTRLDPSNVSAQRNAAVAESRLAELMTNNPAEGVAMIEHAIAALQRVSAADSRPAWRRDLAVAYRREAALHTLGGNPRLAKQSMRRALETIESAAKDDPENSQTQRVLQEVRVAATAAH